WSISRSWSRRTRTLVLSTSSLACFLYVEALYEASESATPRDHTDGAFLSALERQHQLPEPVDREQDTHDDRAEEAEVEDTENDCFCGDETLFDVFERWQWHTAWEQWKTKERQQHGENDQLTRTRTTQEDYMMKKIDIDLPQPIATDFLGCVERLRFDDQIGSPVVTVSFKMDSFCPADLAANAVRCSQMTLNADQALLTQAFR
ncbi:unnamed protein product, partial [Amoebophrya sp. A25]